MNPDAIDEGRRWLLQAEHDLDDTRYNLEGARHHLVCFLAQQSAEKALKAFLYVRVEEMVCGHSVPELCKRAASSDEDLKRIWGEGQRSTNIIARQDTRTDFPMEYQQRRFEVM